MLHSEFEKIEPFHDKDINPALKRITEAPEFNYIASFVFPDNNIEEVKNILNSINTANEFQKKFMHKAVRRVVEESADGLTYEGFDKLNADIPYLFIANHRDIVLDSAILQVLLVEHNIPTTEISLGSNLMISPFIVDFAKVNKMYIVYRGGTRLELLKNAKILSAYIRYAITEKKSSIWIAQKNGRTKNGYDKTEEALLKMLNLSGEGDFLENFSELHIVPLIISYEYEPCGLFKVNELYQSKDAEYIKKPGEDLNSIITGFTQYKGHIHLCAGTPVCSQLNNFSSDNSHNESIKNLAKHIDSEIYNKYKLWKTNYIAYDVLNNLSEYSDFYTEDEKKCFLDFITTEINKINGDKVNLKQIYLEMYANPVFNKKQTIL